MLRNWWGGVWMITFLALAHMWDATQLMGWGVDDNFPCTCTHVRCYATDGVGCGWWLSWWTSQLYIDALIQMALYCNFSWWYSNTLQDCTPLQFLETKTGAPLVVLHPPLSKCCCCLHLSWRLKQGPRLLCSTSPQNNNSQQKHWNFAISLFLYKSLPSFAQTQDPSQTLT